MNLLVGSQYSYPSNLDRINNIFPYLEEEKGIILLELKGPYFSYIIFNPIYCINLKSFLNIITSNQQNNQQDQINYLIITLISLIIKEYKKLQDKKLYHNNLQLQNILIFQLDCLQFTNLKFNQIQIKFYNFQDNSPQKSNDLSQMYELIKEILKVNEKNYKILFLKKILQNKNLEELEQFVSEEQGKMQSIKQNVQPLINLQKLEYIQKVSQKFQEKLKEIDKNNCVEVVIWLYYYSYTQEFENKEFQLSSTLRRIDMDITIYQEAQSKLYGDLIYETNLLNSFYESQFRKNTKEKLQIESIQKELKINMQINIQCEFIQIIKTNLFEQEKGQIRKFTEDIVNNIWKYYETQIQNNFFQLIQTKIVKTIEGYAEFEL